MKITKLISVLSLTLVLLVSSFAITACGSDDNDNNDTSTNPLVGTWRAEVEEKGELQYWEMTYNSNFTFSFMEYNKESNKIHNIERGNYSFMKDNTILVTNESGNSYSMTFKITDGNKLEFLDIDHGIIYYKIK
jgi:hypothetical protein